MFALFRRCECSAKTSNSYYYINDVLVSLNFPLQVATSFYSPNMNVGNENFLPLLKRLDECISWVKKPLSFLYFVFVPLVCPVYRMSPSDFSFGFICFPNWTISVIVDILILILGMLKAIHSMQNPVFTCLNFVNSRCINFTAIVE